MKARTSVLVASSLTLALLACAMTASADTNAVLGVNRSAPASESHDNLSLSVASSQILQLTQAGMDESLITAFISTSGSFQLSADQIVYLTDLGVSNHVIQAMLAHDRERLARAREKTNAANASVSLSQAEVTFAVKPEPASASPETASQSPQTMTTALATTSNPVSKRDLPTQTSHAATVVSQKKKIFYPVRAPYPVELTAPIVFLDAPTF